MSKAIKFKNNMYLDSRGAVHNGTILKTYLDNLSNNINNNTNALNNRGNFITLSKRRDQEPISWSATGTWSRMPYTNVIDSKGSVLSNNETGNMEIASGIKTVRFYAQALCDWSVGGSHWLMLRLTKNGIPITKSIITLQRWATVGAEAIINVSEGDILNAEIYKDTAGTVNLYDYDSYSAARGCYCTIEVLK